MSATDTPRTDPEAGFALTKRGITQTGALLAQHDGPFVLVGFARQLEREADAYAKVLHDSLAREDALYKQLTAAQAKIVELEQDKA